jgi:hypothetical protein
MPKIIFADLNIASARKKINKVGFASEKLLIDCLKALNELEESCGVNNKPINEPNEPITDEWLKKTYLHDKNTFDAYLYNNVDEFITDLKASILLNAVNQLNRLELKLLGIKQD